MWHALMFWQSLGIAAFMSMPWVCYRVPKFTWTLVILCGQSSLSTVSTVSMPRLGFFFSFQAPDCMAGKADDRGRKYEASELRQVPPKGGLDGRNILCPFVMQVMPVEKTQISG